MIGRMASDPFDLLGLRAAYDLDPGEVERAYLRRVARAHPDGGEPGSDAAGADAINRARSVLADPAMRAEALLARQGGPSKEEDRTLPEGFLAAMMQTRLEVEAALASGDPSARATWRAWADARGAEHAGRVARLFAEGPASAETRRLIRRELNAWRYIERLIEQLDPQYDASRAERP